MRVDFLLTKDIYYNNKSKTQKMGMVKKGHPLVQRIGYDEKLKNIYIYFSAQTHLTSTIKKNKKIPFKSFSVKVTPFK